MGLDFLLKKGLSLIDTFKLYRYRIILSHHSENQRGVQRFKSEIVRFTFHSHGLTKKYPTISKWSAEQNSVQ